MRWLGVGEMYSVCSGNSLIERGRLAVFDLSLHQLLIRAGACVLVTAIHGFALAAIARALGDRGPQFDERLTANPLRHLDIIGAPLMILAQLGWIRPIAIDPTKLRFGRLGLIVCVVGSIAATLAAVALLLALRIPALTYLPNAIVPTVIATLNEAAEMCTWFAAFNLVPLPPLTGVHLIVAVRPALAPLLAKYQVYAACALAVLTVFGGTQMVVQPIRDVLVSVVPV
jgi:Zn-dependent protease